MRNAARRGGWAAVAAVFVLVYGMTPAHAAGNRSRMIAGMTAALSDERHTAIDDMSEAELQGAGCLLSGAAGTLAAYSVGANEVVMVVAGGVLAPSTPAVMGVVMLATVFTSGCAVGAIAAPFFHWGYRQAVDQGSQAAEIETPEQPVSPSAPTN